MPRNGWFGVLPFLERWDASDSKEPSKQGLVLAGGGALGGFQIGALRYLYTHADLAPTSVVGTSVGSIVGAMLAQSIDPVEQHQHLKNLERLWLGMQTQADLFAERRWFATLRSQGPDWLKLIDTEPPPADDQPNPLARLALPFQKQEPAPTVPSAPSVPSASDPAATIMELVKDEEDAPTIEWTPTIIMQLMNAAPKIGKAGADLTKALRDAEVAGSMYRPGRIITHLLSRKNFDPDKLANSGMQFRAAMVGLRSGQLRFMREDGNLVDRSDRRIGGEPTSLPLGILASCSIPGVFRPVPVNDEYYVDGGTRESVPVELAVASLGVTKPYVVTCHTMGVPAMDKISPRDMISVVMRSAQIVLDEAERDEVAYARASGAIVIDPEFAVHDLMTVEPGLMQINRDYGWLRAAEEHLDASPQTAQLHRDIISARMLAWEQERKLIGRADATDDDMKAVSDTKFQIRDLLKSADPRMLPDEAATWWQNFEKHADEDAAGWR